MLRGDGGEAAVAESASGLLSDREKLGEAAGAGPGRDGRGQAEVGGSRPRWAGPGRSGAGPGRSEQGQAERDRGEGLRHRQGQSQDGAHGAPGEGDRKSVV